jgi:hypothetical protein
MNDVIIYTDPGGTVTICHLPKEVLAAMQNGGFCDQSQSFMDEQIERQIAAGLPEFAVRRYVKAAAFGGLTEAEAFEVLRDRDCANGTAHERVKPSDLPDRWFRYAWQRSHNGGPIVIDMKKAKRIQMNHLKRFAEVKRLDLQWARWRERVRRAETPLALKHVWPDLH